MSSRATLCNRSPPGGPLGCHTSLLTLLCAFHVPAKPLVLRRRRRGPCPPHQAEQATAMASTQVRRRPHYPHRRLHFVCLRREILQGHDCKERECARKPGNRRYVAPLLIYVVVRHVMSVAFLIVFALFLFLLSWCYFMVRVFPSLWHTTISKSI